MTEEASVPADGVVAYRHFAVPTNFTEDKYVQFAEIKRGDPAVVHHVIVSVREPGQGPMPPAGEINLGGAANREGGAMRSAQAAAAEAEATRQHSRRYARWLGAGDEPVEPARWSGQADQEGLDADLPDALHD